MRKFVASLLLTTLISFWNPMAAQNCKWAVEKMDPITEKISLQSKIVGMAAWKTSMTIWVIKADGKNYLKSAYLTMSLIMDTEIQNPELKIRLEDGKLLTLVPDDISKTLSGGGVAVYFMNPINDTDLKYLSESNPTALSTSFNAIQATFEPKKKDASSLSSYALCLLNYKTD